MFYKHVIGCQDTVIGGAFDSFVGAVKSVVKSPVTKAIAGGVAIAFPPVGVPAAAAIAATDMAITTTEAATGQPIEKSAKAVVATTKKAAASGDKDSIRGERVLRLNQLASTPKGRAVLKAVLANKEWFRNLTSATMYKVVRDKIESANASDKSAARKAGRKLPPVKRMRVPSLVARTDANAMAIARLNALGAEVRYPVARDFLRRAAGNTAVKKLLGASKLSAAGLTVQKKLAAAIGKYNAVGKARGQAPVRWSPLAGGTRSLALPTLKAAPADKSKAMIALSQLSPEQQAQLRSLAGAAKNRGQLIKSVLAQAKEVKRGPVGLGQKANGILITPTSIQHSLWTRSA